jgi:hypothetical protein
MPMSGMLRCISPPTMPQSPPPLVQQRIVHPSKSIKRPHHLWHRQAPPFPTLCFLLDSATSSTASTRSIPRHRHRDSKAVSTRASSCAFRICLFSHHPSSFMCATKKNNRVGIIV